MKTIALICPVGSRPGYPVSTAESRFFEPYGGKVATLNLIGFCFIRPAVRAKLPVFQRLDQVNALMGRNNDFFLGGLFLLFSLVYSDDTFCSLFFSFE